MGFFVRIVDKNHYPCDFTAEDYLSQDDRDLIETREKALSFMAAFNTPSEQGKLDRYAYMVEWGKNE